MSKIIFILLLSTALFSQEPSPLIEINSFGTNPGNLKMFVHTNETKDTNKVPLVIVLHGCSESAKGVSELTGWNKLADINNFIVVYPQQKIANNPNLCFNWFLKQDIDKGSGECESIYEMISYAKKNYKIDTNNIYITGLSAGAAMSVVMASTHPQTFKMAAIFAGGAYKVNEDATESLKAMKGRVNISQDELIKRVRLQNPSYKGSYPALIVYQGLKDPIVHRRSSKYIIQQWTGLNNCDTIPTKVEFNYLGVEDIKRSEFTNKTGKVVLTFYEINNMGHRLLIKPGNKEDEGGKLGIFGINKGFHSTYQTAKEFGILKKKN
jgi:poly(hydroxyalkanoate) depolymerase family esterase